MLYKNLVFINLFISIKKKIEKDKNLLLRKNI